MKFGYISPDYYIINNEKGMIIKTMDTKRYRMISIRDFME